MKDYRDTLKTGEGSFRGVPFFITEGLRQSGGRRVVKREFPRRDDGGADEMGRRLRERSFQCCVFGLDYQDKRDALIEALDAPGQGELVHPLFGSLKAVIDKWDTTESLDKQGCCDFDITFYEPLSDTAPESVPDTAGAVDGQATTAEDALNGDFAESWSMKDLSLHDIQSMVDGATQAVNTITESVNSMLSWVDGVESVLSELTELRGSVQSLINLPATMARRFTSVVGSIRGLGTVSDSLATYKTLGARLHFGGASRPVGGRAAMRQQKSVTIVRAGDAARPVSPQAVNNLLALDTLIVQLTTLNTARATTDATTQAISNAELRTRSRAVTALLPQLTQKEVTQANPLESRATVMMVADLLAAELDEHVLTASNLRWGGTSQALRAFRLLYLADMRLRAERLPESVEVRLVTTEPALVTVYRQTGDSRGWLTFARRNDVINPLFVPGGEAVEVLINE